MWCPNCEADVAAEVTADHRRVQCATCGSEITATAESRGDSKTRQARELLERWSSQRLLDPYAPPATMLQAAVNQEESVEPPPAPAPTTVPRSRPKFRVDSSHPVGAALPPEPTTRVDAWQSGPPAPHAAAFQPYRPVPEPAPYREIHPAHDPYLRAPHFEVSPRGARNLATEQRPTNWLAGAGQVLAYGGVALLTAGTSLVIWGYFGGHDQYTPTGWLITTVGQMLLFLGVVTMVSGGMDQTTDEVSRRIEQLGDKLLRIEYAASQHALRGPHSPPAAYSDLPEHAGYAHGQHAAPPPMAESRRG